MLFEEILVKRGFFFFHFHIYKKISHFRVVRHYTYALTTQTLQLIMIFNKLRKEMN